MIRLPLKKIEMIPSFAASGLDEQLRKSCRLLAVYVYAYLAF